MELSDARIDRALGMAYRELADDAADGLDTAPQDLMHLVLDGLGEIEGTPDQALIELARRGLISAWVDGSEVHELGNEQTLRSYSVEGIALTKEGLARGQEAAGSL